MHMKPNQQHTWGYHAFKAWYSFHAANHYCCIQVLMAGTGCKRITNTFRFKHYAILVPEIIATNKIINATTRLTATIAGIQDAPPHKIEAIQSLCTLLLGKVALLHSPTPSILPTPPPLTPVINKDEPIIIWNPHLVQPALSTTISTPAISTPTATLLQLSRRTAAKTHLSPVNAPALLITISFGHYKTIVSHGIN